VYTVRRRPWPAQDRHFTHAICLVGSDGRALMTTLGGPDVSFVGDRLDVVSVLSAHGARAGEEEVRVYDSASRSETSFRPASELAWPLGSRPDMRRRVMDDHALLLPFADVPRGPPDEVRRARELERYANSKSRVFAVTTACVLGAAAAACSLGAIEEAAACLLGGGLGLGYLAMLAAQIDAVERPVLPQVIGALRFVVTALSVALVDVLFADEIRERPGLLVVGLLGFSAFRVAAAIVWIPDSVAKSDVGGPE
jgi:hypothetical protein